MLNHTSFAPARESLSALQSVVYNYSYILLPTGNTNGLAMKTNGQILRNIFLLIAGSAGGNRLVCPCLQTIQNRQSIFALT